MYICIAQVSPVVHGFAARCDCKPDGSLPYMTRQIDAEVGSRRACKRTTLSSVVTSFPVDLALDDCPRLEQATERVERVYLYLYLALAGCSLSTPAASIPWLAIEQKLPRGPVQTEGRTEEEINAERHSRKVRKNKLLKEWKRQLRRARRSNGNSA